MPGEQLILLGVNHKTTPVAIREKIALSGGYDEPLAALKEHGRRSRSTICFPPATGWSCCWCRAAVSSVEEEVWTSSLVTGFPPKTCRKLSLYALPVGRRCTTSSWSPPALIQWSSAKPRSLASSKRPIAMPPGFGCTGPLLNRLLHKAFSVAKRVRTETGIGSSAVSISYAAVQLAKKIFGNLAREKGAADRCR